MSIFRLRQKFRCRAALQSMRVLVLDVDGVLTDGGLFYGENGEVNKRFDVRDGLGIRLLQQAGIEVVFFSGGKAGAIEIRAQHLGIRHCFFGVRDKAEGMFRLLTHLLVTADEVAFVGDDLNDLAVRPYVGLLVATADATDPLRRQSDLVLNAKGGHGAVRELAELILKRRGLWTALAENGWRDRND
ncbi:MAG: HAD hydrolase family protein [Pseudohongiella sp.]|nr:HAD hydrolase family protein [Pseudohongiella sp.]